MFECSSNERKDGHAFSMAVREDSGGTHRSSSHSWTDGGTWIRAEVGGTVTETGERQGYAGGGGSLRVIDSDGIMEAAWAAWGRNVGCSLRVGGVVIAGTPQPLDRAAFLRSTDFDSVVSFDSTMASGAVAGEHRHDVSGPLLATLRAEYGSLEISGPEGQLYGDPGRTSLSVYEEDSHGEWLFKATGTKALLWIMNPIDFPPAS